MTFNSQLPLVKTNPTLMSNSSLFPKQLSQSIGQAGVIAVLVIDDLQHAVPLAETLLSGGIKVIELTLRTPVAAKAIQTIRDRFPEMTVGAGTVLTTEQTQQAADAGACFAVAPGTNASVIERSRDIGLPFAPGICTPSDIEAAVQCGCRLLKFFHAHASGELKYLSSINAPYAHLELQYIPLGGINQDTMASYLSDPIVHSIGGSWIATRELIVAGDWPAIEQRARQAVQTVIQSRGNSEQ